MALEEHLVTGLAVVLAAEEVVESDLVQARRGGVSGDVTPNAEAGPVSTADHNCRVPPYICPNTAFHILVAGKPRLALRRNRVDVVRAAQAGHAHLLLASALEQPQHDIPGPGPAMRPDNVIEGLQPLPGLVRIYVRELSGQSVADDGKALSSGGHGDSSQSAGGQAGSYRCPLGESGLGRAALHATS